MFKRFLMYNQEGVNNEIQRYYLESKKKMISTFILSINTLLILGFCLQTNAGIVIFSFALFNTLFFIFILTNFRFS